MGRRKDARDAVKPKSATNPVSSTKKVVKQKSTKYLPIVEYAAKIAVIFVAAFFVILYASRPVYENVTSFTLGDVTGFVSYLVEDPIWVIIRLIIGFFIICSYFGIWLESYLTPGNDSDNTQDTEDGYTGHKYQDMLRSAKTTLDPRKGSLFLSLLSIFQSLVYEIMFVLGCGGLIIQGVIFLLGGPVYSKFTETAALSVLISVLAFTTFAYAFGRSNVYSWRRFVGLETNSYIEKAALWPSIGTLLGSWVGAFLIPLDWNEPWQQYPTTIVLGALLGWALGHIVALLATMIAAAFDPTYLSTTEPLSQSQSQTSTTKTKTS